MDFTPLLEKAKCTSFGGDTSLLSGLFCLLYVGKVMIRTFLGFSQTFLSAAFGFGLNWILIFLYVERRIQ